MTTVSCCRHCHHSCRCCCTVGAAAFADAAGRKHHQSSSSSSSSSGGSSGSGLMTSIEKNPEMKPPCDDWTKKRNVRYRMFQYSSCVLLYCVVSIHSVRFVSICIDLFRFVPFQFNCATVQSNLSLYSTLLYSPHTMSFIYSYTL